MHCDLVPLVGNNAGDWLCMQINGEGQFDQIVQWYHGGGDWIPWGTSLPEAILMDAVIDRLPGPSRRHAEPAEDPRPNTDLLPQDRLLSWACEHLPPAARDLLDNNLPGEMLASELLRFGLAEVAVRCELMVDQLTHPDRDRIVESLTGQVDSNLLAEWLFDLDRMPEVQRECLEREGIQLEGRQGWDLVSTHAQRITDLAPDLAWGWDLAGYAIERRGDSTRAAGFYQSGANCSVFTDQSTRLETHWQSNEFAKFSVSRLHHLFPDRIAESNYYRSMTGPDVRQRRMQVTEYWLERASGYEQDDEWRQTHHCLAAAAWDVGIDSILMYATLLERIAWAAAQSGQLARAELADTHRRCLKDRYGM
ncbi:MAG: hypothetical protein P8L85_24515 [Rubripirellula sp.]|nr:hypothetical protein [Rubripirellula sp.]